MRLRQVDLGLLRMHAPSATSRLERVDLRRPRVGQQQVVAPHQLVADRHQLAEHLVRRLGDADVVAEALRHLLDAVEPLEQRRRHHDLRLEPVGRHDVAADVEIEQLIGAAELDVGLEEHRVVGLRERIEELVHGDRLAALVALPEIAALEHLRDVVARRQSNQPFGCRAASASALLKSTTVFAGIEDLEHLRLVGLGVRARSPPRVSGGRVFDRPVGSPISAGEVADQEHHAVPEVLEVLHLPDQHGVAQVQVGRRRIEPDLDDERLARSSPIARASLGVRRARTTSTQPFVRYASCSSRVIGVRAYRTAVAERLPNTTRRPAICPGPRGCARPPLGRSVLDLQDPRGERFRVSSSRTGTARCRHDRTGVELRRDEVHGRATDFDAMLERLRCASVPGNDGSSDGWMLRMALETRRRTPVRAAA